MATRADSMDDYDAKRSVASPTTEEGQGLARIEETIFNPELKAAIDKTQLDPLSRRAIALYFICMVAFMNAISSGASAALTRPSYAF